MQKNTKWRKCTDLRLQYLPVPLVHCWVGVFCAVQVYSSLTKAKLDQESDFQQKLDSF